MPIYVYEPKSGACEQCGGSFEHKQGINETPLEACIKCGQACQRVIQAVSSIGAASRPALDRVKEGLEAMKSANAPEKQHRCSPNCRHK